MSLHGLSVGMQSMKVNKSVCIVVPIYRQLTESELISLQSLENHLSQYTISFLSSQKWDLTTTLKHEWKIVEAHWLNSHQSYNRMMYSESFYRWYENYEWIFIFQLDGLILNGDLERWTAQNQYDFIGAPGIAYDSEGRALHVKRGFNGGVSLRRTSAFLNIFKKRVIVSVEGESFERFKWFRKCKLPFKTCVVKKIFELNSSLNRYYLYRIKGLMEDGYWSYAVRDQQKSLRCASESESMAFCFDRSPRYLYSLTSRLPFAAHAWEKWEVDFWKEMIHFE